MKAIVGARDMWPTPALVGRVLAIIVSTDEDFCIRGARTQASSPTEEVVLRICERLDRHITIFSPTPTEGNGRNWLRDNRMIAKTTEVFAFFGPDGTEGGTEHIVAVALRMGKPVIAYAPDNHGELIEVASDEGFVQSVAEYEEHEWH